MFLLNIAQAYRQLDDLERTRAFYKKFVEQTPPHHPAHVQALLALEKLDAQIRDRAAAAAATTTTPEPAVATPTPPAAPETSPPSVTATTPAPAPAPRRSRAPGWAGVALVAVGVVALAAGAGLTAGAYEAHDRYLHPVDGMPYDPQPLRERDLDRTLAITSFAVGGALVIVGTVLAARFLPRRSSPVAARAGGLPLEVRF